MAQSLNDEAKQKEGLSVESIDEMVMTNTAIFSTSSISPQSAFFGGIIAQEIVKFTGKYSPLKQWLFYDIFEAIPEGEVDRTPQNSRYDDQIKIFGKDI